MTPEQYEHARDACIAILPWLTLVAVSLIVCRFDWLSRK